MKESRLKEIEETIDKICFDKYGDEYREKIDYGGDIYDMVDDLITALREARSLLEEAAVFLKHDPLQKEFTSTKINKFLEA